MNTIKLYALIILAAFSFSSSTAQTPVELNIKHMLGGESFAFNKNAKNDLGNNFNVTRMEYYISNISIKHDGGMITPVTDHYILANAGADITEGLGSLNITSVEEISFYIGVDTPENHEDPSLRPMGDPLEPKTPSMHWGWAGGYRFAAIEGKSGTALDQTFEIHALGDQNYFQVTIPVSGVTQGGKIIIPLKAEYAFALKGIDLSAGVVEHSDAGAAVTLLNNFKTSVFSAWFPVGVNTVRSADAAIKIYPNPSNGQASLDLGSINGTATVDIYDVQGRVVASYSKAAAQSSVPVYVQSSGLYMVKVVSQNGDVFAKKLRVL